MSKHILWVSRHPPLESQINELNRLFGDVLVSIDPTPFENAQAIIERAKNYDEIVMVAPLSVIAEVCKLGIKPLWAEMEQTSWKNKEVKQRNKYLKFKKFYRIVGVDVKKEEV